MIDFWFDPISPYAWIAGRQLHRLDEVGAEVRVRPVLFAALLNAHGNVGPAEIPAKRAHTFRDVVRTAARLGLPLEGPPAHPFNPLKALRMCASLDAEAARRRLALALMDATWSRGEDLESETTLARIADALGLPGEALVAGTSDAAVKKRLADATSEALALGVFGVPTFVLDGELFWGSDRFDDLLLRVAGQRLDEDKLSRMLARPAAATRR